MKFYFADTSVDFHPRIADVAAAQEGIDVVGFDAHFFADAVVAVVTVASAWTAAAGQRTSAFRRSSLAADEHLVTLTGEIRRRFVHPGFALLFSRRRSRFRYLRNHTPPQK